MIFIANHFCAIGKCYGTARAINHDWVCVNDTALVSEFVKNNISVFQFAHDCPSNRCWYWCIKRQRFAKPAAHAGDVAHGLVRVYPVDDGLLAGVRLELVQGYKHTKTLAAIFAKPTAAQLEWSKIESLLIGVGCTVIEGNGSRVKFCHGTTVASFHRPHPAKEAKAYQVDDARAFLTLIGVTP